MPASCSARTNFFEFHRNSTEFWYNYGCEELCSDTRIRFFLKLIRPTYSGWGSRKPLYMVVVGPQGFEPWTLGLKDRFAMFTEVHRYLFTALLTKLKSRAIHRSLWIFSPVAVKVAVKILFHARGNELFENIYGNASRTSNLD